jgi:hypothetical protein
MQTKKTLAPVVAASLLVLLILSAKSADMANPPLLIQPPPQDTNCYPAGTNVLCDPEPAPQFLSVTVTNQCAAGAMILANATYTNVPGTITTTITYSNTACPPLVSTNAVSSAILTNWWEATGDAVPSSGAGLGASFSPPNNCSGGTVYFYITYSNAPPCSNHLTIQTSIAWACDCDCTHHIPGVGNEIPFLGVCGGGSSYPPWSTNSLCGDTFSIECDGAQVHAASPGGPCGVCPYPRSEIRAWYTFCLCKAKIMETRFDVVDTGPSSPTRGQGSSSVWTCTTSCTISNFTVGSP